jgi:LPXTG-motif cell wall-anchored protein
MTCTTLPATGLSANLPLMLVGGLALLLVGGALLVASRRSRRGAMSLVVIALLFATGVGAVAVMGVPAAAQAAGSGCSTSTGSDDRLSAIQTSTMTGLAPGADPAPITGRLVNHSNDSTHVSAVEVAITTVTPAPGAPTGGCGPRDYLILKPQMRVERTLGPGAAAPFTGAAIGFANKNLNQDACQGATIHLRYTANPH